MNDDDDGRKMQDERINNKWKYRWTREEQVDKDEVVPNGL